MMKKLLLSLLMLLLFAVPSQAQLGVLRGILKGVKSAVDAKRTKKNPLEEWGNTKVRDLYKDVKIDTVSIDINDYEQMLETYKDIPELKIFFESKGDTAVLGKYFKELYRGMSPKEIQEYNSKRLGVDYNSPEFKDCFAKMKNGMYIQNDSVFKKIVTEQRQPTMQEAIYLKKTYGLEFEYTGMEAYDDSIGVYANLDGKMKAMNVAVPATITDEKPIPDFGLDAIKQYVQEYISVLKNPFADREIIDSVQNYMVYNHRHADEQFKGTAKFTIYSNMDAGTDVGDVTVKDLLLRMRAYFSDPIDPKDIFVFKVHKGIGCRYMEYMYSKISYKTSDLHDYIINRLINEGYVDAQVNQQISDEQIFRIIDKMEYEFQMENLLKIRTNNEKFIYYNVIPEAKEVKISSNVRNLGAHVTALDITIDAEPGEYAFVIGHPENEDFFDEDDLGYNVSVLNQGAYFFTIK